MSHQCVQGHADASLCAWLAVEDARYEGAISANGRVDLNSKLFESLDFDIRRMMSMTAKSITAIEQEAPSDEEDVLSIFTVVDKSADMQEVAKWYKYHLMYASKASGITMKVVCKDSESQTALKAVLPPADVLFKSMEGYGHIVSVFPPKSQWVLFLKPQDRLQSNTPDVLAGLVMDLGMRRQSIDLFIHTMSGLSMSVPLEYRCVKAVQRDGKYDCEPPAAPQPCFTASMNKQASCVLSLHSVWLQS